MLSSKKLQKMVLKDTALASFVAYYILEYNSATVRAFIDYLIKEDKYALDKCGYYHLTGLFHEWMESKNK